MASARYSGDQLTEKVIGCIIKVHQKLGPGFIESIYRSAIVIECSLQGMRAQYEKVILELKQVDELGRAQYAQVRSYLKATGLKRALLVNFAKAKADIRRIETN
jgi:hypothetical protein